MQRTQWQRWGCASKEHACQLNKTGVARFGVVRAVFSPIATHSKQYLAPSEPLALVASDTVLKLSLMLDRRSNAGGETPETGLLLWAPLLWASPPPASAPELPRLCVTSGIGGTGGKGRRSRCC